MKLKFLNSITIIAISICILFDIILEELSIFPYIWIGINYILFRLIIKLWSDNNV